MEYVVGSGKTWITLPEVKTLPDCGNEVDTQIFGLFPGLLYSATNNSMLIDIRNETYTGNHLIIVAGELIENPEIIPANNTVYLEILPRDFEWNYLAKEWRDTSNNLYSLNSSRPRAIIKDISKRGLVEIKFSEKMKFDPSIMQ